MTHQYTKLADALENIAQMEYPSAHHDGKNLREAAALLRAAAGVDVAGLMAMVKEHALNCYELGAIKSDVKNHAQQRMKVAGFYAALESALRMALAGRVAELEKDARRLDAVERNRFELTPLEGGGWDVSQYHSETCDSQLFAVGELTARAAIDSAALAAKGQA